MHEEEKHPSEEKEREEKPSVSISSPSPGPVSENSGLLQMRQRGFLPERGPAIDNNTLESICASIASSSISPDLVYQTLITSVAFNRYIRTPADIRKLLQTFPAYKEDIYQKVQVSRHLMVIENTEQLREIFAEHANEINPNQPREPERPVYRNL